VRGAVLVGVVVAGVVAAGWVLAPPASPSFLPTAAGVRFLAMGDTGTGGQGQYDVARAALEVCRVHGCDHAILLGDNIYENGVDSAHDPQFETKFEQPYAAFAMPFWMALGNHDNGGLLGTGDGSQQYRGDFQVAYHHRTDRTSDKWHMPARHYTFRTGDAQFWALDTNLLMYGGGLPVPGDPVWMGMDPAGAAQLQWLQGSLAASDAPWKVVFAHHPYVSNGRHGDAGMYEGVPGLGMFIKVVVELGVCGNADLYVTGHDHDLQWLAAQERCGHTEFVVSGAGAKTRPLGDPDRNPAHFQQGDTLGFAWFEVQSSTLRGRFHDTAGVQLFERTLTKPG
jgi:tartrate-resistant acid phosphatase type 5